MSAPPDALSVARPLDPILESYEAVAYESKAVPLAEPDVMAAAAILHGLTPPRPERARVLELGCGTAGNLIAMAMRLRKATFIGVDLSPAQIERASYAVSELGLQNVTVIAKSIADIDAAFGEFDYIICHGVYSWVPEAVRDAILRVCAENLAPNGVAYVSYNTYPGWHRRGMVREMLKLNDDPALPPSARVARARDLANMLAAADPADDSPHGLILHHELRELAKQSDRHLFHDQLAPINEPVYFARFAQHARAHGLRYVGEARLSVESLATTNLRTVLGSDADIVQVEQQLDFVRGREFRRTLLCHDDQHPSAAPVPEAIPKLFARTTAQRAEASAEDAARSEHVAAFRAPTGVMLTTNNPQLIAMLGALVDVAPAALGFDALSAEVARRLAGPEAASPSVSVDRDALIAALLQTASAGLVEFRALPSSFVAHAGERPKAAPLARWQAGNFDFLTSLAHAPVRVTGVERYMLRHLDGTNDRERLLHLLEHAFRSGELQLGGATLTREQIAGVLDDVLERLGRSGLLVA